jgi:hypothetical protein
MATVDFSLTRGSIVYFKSSDKGERGFCPACGTLLTYRCKSLPRVTMSIASFDRHSELRPEFQFATESYEPWFADLSILPSAASGEAYDTGTHSRGALDKIQRSSRQHLDHDTATWPLKT